ncbi:unnamed protein product [Ectocarpus sp. 6 AP-2014]
MLFGVAMMAEFWLESLPHQLVSPGSFAEWLTKVSHKHNIFLVIGFLNAGTISTLGILTLFMAFWPPLLADFVVVSGASISFIVIIFVAVRITSFINHALSESSHLHQHAASSNEFYGEAKKNLWKQALALCSTGCAVILAIAVRHLTQFGRTTPIVSWTAEMLCGHAAAVLFMSLTQFHAAAPAMSSTATNHWNLITTMRSRSESLISSGAPEAVAGVVMLFLNWLRSCMLHPGSTKKSHPQSPPRQQYKEKQQEAINSLSSDLEDYEIVTCMVKSESVAEKIINHKVSSIGTNKSRVLPTLG